MKIDITEAEYKTIREEGLSLDSVLMLLLIEAGNETKYFGDQDVAFSGMLKLRGYVQDGKVTNKGKEFLKTIEKERPAAVVELRGEMLTVFVRNLHMELQGKLLSLTGKKQKMLQGKYAFLCNATDLEKKLRDVFKKYGVQDLMKIRGVLLNYIDRCSKMGWEKVSLVEYYLMKNEVSKMMTDLDTFEEVIDDKPAPLVDPKNLF